MSMNIAFYKKDLSESYSLSAPLGGHEKLWLSNLEGEGGDFPANEIADVIYTALDKYFREKY